MVKKALTESPRYRSFISQRDRALETIHQKTQMRITDLLGGLLERVMEVASYHYGQSQGSIYAMRHLEQQIDKPFKDSVNSFLTAILDMRRRVYLLTHASEAEAIGRATGKPQHFFLDKSKGHAQYDKESPAGGDLSQRIHLYLDRIKHDVMDALKISALNDQPINEALDNIRRTLPKVRSYIRPPRVLKPLKEKSYNLGSQSNPQVMSVGFIDDQDWQDMIDEYQNDYIFTNRGPDGVLDEEAAIPQYEWELEQDVTQDFVHRVREGQIDAAKENGITDFVWISIIDDRTDDCCLWRNGLTTKEISLALQGEHADDECTGDTVPLHFNCRCSLAPMTEDMPEQPPSSIGDFEDWLNETSS